MDYVKHNSNAWDNEVKEGNQWTKEVSKEIIEMAKKGEWEIFLTPTKKVPINWFGDIKGKKILCLASGGGQQAPILSAIGGKVTVFDNSIEQLNKDKMVAERDNLEITFVQGDMRDLSCFANEEFDLIVHPISNLFVDDILVVWKECNRILKTGGRLLSGFTNPINYIFDYKSMEKGELKVINSIPYSDLKTFSDFEIKEFIENKLPFEFGHSLENQINGQIEAGFIITGFYEDNYGGQSILDKYIDMFIATCAIKMKI